MLNNIMDEEPGYGDLLFQPFKLENPTHFRPGLRVKEEFLDIKDELIPVHYLEVSPAHYMEGSNVDNVNIKSENWSDDDPLSIVEKQSGCDSADKASCNYKPSELTSLELTKSEFNGKRNTSKNIDLNNSALYYKGNPTNCVTEYSKLGPHTVRNFCERKYICNECNKCFTVRRNFIAHLEVHSGERKHKCQECGKCFNQRSSLGHHFLIHSGERKHKCQECGKCFTYRSNLVQHFLIHSGEIKRSSEDH